MIHLTPSVPAHYPYLKALYKSAFPPNERKPFPLVLRQSRKGRMILHTIMDDNTPCGLAFIETDGRLALLGYLATDEHRRGQGIGAKALALLKALYRDHRLFLEMEEPRDTAPNAEQRRRRYAFYLRNGFQDNGLRAHIYRETMYILCAFDPVTFPEYRALVYHVNGPLIGALMNPRPAHN